LFTKNRPLKISDLQKSYSEGQKKWLKNEQRIEKMPTFAALLINKIVLQI